MHTLEGIMLIFAGIAGLVLCVVAVMVAVNAKNSNPVKVTASVAVAVLILGGSVCALVAGGQSFPSRSQTPAQAVASLQIGVNNVSSAVRTDIRENGFGWADDTAEAQSDVADAQQALAVAQSDLKSGAKSSVVFGAVRVGERYVSAAQNTDAYGDGADD